MDDLISRKMVLALPRNKVRSLRTHEVIEETINVTDIEHLPSAQPDTRSLEQIKWERDIAIQQLKDLGYSLGEKIRTDEDTISRRAALDVIFPYCPDDDGTCSKNGDDLRNLLDDIENLPSAQPEQRWIPCSEGLPEVHETGNSFSGVFMQSYPVLVYGVPEGEEECGFHVVTYCDDLNGYTYWSTELDAVTIDGVRAWMPLPEPYAERREE